MDLEPILSIRFTKAVHVRVEAQLYAKVGGVDVGDASDYAAPFLFSRVCDHRLVATLSERDGFCAFRENLHVVIVFELAITAARCNLLQDPESLHVGRKVVSFGVADL